MNFNENDLWRNKTDLLNLRLSKLPITKVLLKLEFDTEDQVLFEHIFTYPKLPKPMMIMMGLISIVLAGNKLKVFPNLRLKT